MVVAALGLDGLDDERGGGLVPGGDQPLRLGETALLLGGVGVGVLRERIPQLGEWRLWPVEGGDVEFVDGLAARGGQRAEEAAVEGGAEAEDAEGRRAGGRVVHRGGDLVGGEVGGGVAAALHAPFPHEGGFVGELVGVGAGGAGEDLVEALGGDFEDACLEDGGPVVLGEVAQSGPVDDGAGHFGGGGGEHERGVAVADGDGGDLGVDVQEDVAVEISNVVADALLVVGHHVQAPCIKDLVQLLNGSLALGARYFGLDDWSSRLIWEEGLVDKLGGSRRLLNSSSSGRSHGTVGLGGVCSKG